MAVLAIAGLFLALNWFVVTNIKPLSRLEIFLLGAGFLYLVRRMWRPTLEIIRGQRAVSNSDKIAAVFILGLVSVMAMVAYNSRDYFMGGFKANNAALALMRGSIPGFENWNTLGREERKRALPALIGFLGHEDRYVRSNAARCLGSMGEDAVEAIPALTSWLEMEHRVPSTAASALARLGPRGEEVLLRELESKDTLVRDAADYALKNKGKAY